jgi:hypothetical protein
MKDDGIVEARPFSEHCFEECVPRDQNVVRLPVTKHLDANKVAGDNDGVQAIYANAIHRLEP